MTREEVSYAARQAWVGFWQTCVRDTGGTSVLSYDAKAVDGLLNGHAEPPVAKPSPLARALGGDPRISEITLADVLEGLEDYFLVFRELKKINQAAYDYFSRVGAPLCFNGSAVWRDSTDFAGDFPVVNPEKLPTFLGLYMPRSRQDIIDDKPMFEDFALYEKRRSNVAVASPWKWVLYDYQVIYLDHRCFSRPEYHRFPWLNNFAAHYFIGVEQGGGQVRALPMRCEHRQRLKNGHTITHAEFRVPAGLQEMAGRRTVDQLAASKFAVIRAFCASALSGVQLSVRRGNQVARFGIPLSHVRGFFSDRDRVGNRRAPLLHYVGEHSRVLKNGRLSTVGEHLRGARHFTWRDYSIILSAPGIHHPPPEALATELICGDDLEPAPRYAIPTREVGEIMQRMTGAAPRVPFRRGEPTIRYATHSLGA